MASGSPSFPAGLKARIESSFIRHLARLLPLLRRSYRTTSQCRNPHPSAAEVSDADEADKHHRPGRLLRCRGRGGEAAVGANIEIRKGQHAVHVRLDSVAEVEVPAVGCLGRERLRVDRAARCGRAQEAAALRGPADRKESECGGRQSRWRKRIEIQRQGAQARTQALEGIEACSIQFGSIARVGVSSVIKRLGYGWLRARGESDNIGPKRECRVHGRLIGKPGSYSEVGRVCCGQILWRSAVNGQ
jgi:hypothetical protein